MFLQLKDVVKQYSNQDGTPFTVLDQIQLDVAEGEFISLLGPSGCGKSTLLSLVAGLIETTAGELLLEGQQIQGPGPDRGVVFQEAALFPWLTALDNVKFGLRKKLTPKEAEQKAYEHLQMVHLSGFTDRYPHELSGGMQQRVAIARALAMNPKVLLMDEPFGALDEQTRNMLHIEVEKLWLQQRKTILFVTHNIREALKLSDRIVVMGTRPGRILKDYAVPLPRPRSEHGEQIAEMEAEIMSVLKTEIDKVMAEEFGYGNCT